MGRCLQLDRHLDTQFLSQHQTRPVHSSPQKLAHPVAMVLTLLAWEWPAETDQATAGLSIWELSRRRESASSAYYFFTWTYG